MTEDEAGDWLKQRFSVSRGTMLTEFVALLRSEAVRQNLVAASTMDQLWTRHVVDSAQLLELAADDSGCWLDIGSGAGLPGIVVALLSDRPVILVEPRRRRAEFLQATATHLGISHRVEVIASKVESVVRSAAVISARAVAPLSVLLGAAQGCATSRTCWLLPKGRSAAAEVELARRTWHGNFSLVPSVTDQESYIVVADGISRR